MMNLTFLLEPHQKFTYMLDIPSQSFLCFSSALPVLEKYNNTLQKYNCYIKKDQNKQKNIFINN